MTPASELTQNQLLAAFPGAERQRWLPLLEPVDLAVGQVLQEPALVPHYVYFPTTAVVSLLYLSEDGACDEIAVVGREAPAAPFGSRRA